jgi:hypothetical protein
MRAALLAVLAYIVSSFAAAALAGSANSAAGRTSWRLVGWIVPLIVFSIHVSYECVRRGNPSMRVARHVAVAVALGAFLFAAGAPVASHWSEGHLSRLVLLSLVLWPILTGVPAFVAAFAAASILGRFVRREPTSGMGL